MGCSTSLQVIAKRAPRCLRLLDASAVTDRIVRVTLERDVRDSRAHAETGGLVSYGINIPDFVPA
jgi:hypothetical protein